MSIPGTGFWLRSRIRILTLRIRIRIEIIRLRTPLLYNRDTDQMLNKSAIGVSTYFFLNAIE